MQPQLKFAIGNLKRGKFTTILNLVGLTSAFAAFTLIMIYVWNERHFDCYNKNIDEIYRLEVKSPDNQKTSVFLLGPTGETLVNEFPEIEVTTTYMPWGKWGEEAFRWEKNNEEIKSFEDYAYGDEFLTDVFTFNFIKGKKTDPLFEPQTAIVSESFAIKAWGDEDPIGKQIKTATGNFVYTVTAVFANLPENSVIQSPIILKLPTTGFIAEARTGWNVTNYPQFIRVKKGTNPKILNDKINTESIVRSKYNFYNSDAPAKIVARPLRDLHFVTETAETPMFTSNSSMFVNSLFWVGILILVVALINYINFATAGVPRRIKSIGVTRIIGNSRFNSASVFVLETILLFAFSFAGALMISGFVSENFSKSVLGYTLPFFENVRLLALFGLGSIILGALTGLYPALYSTSGKPVETLKHFSVNPKINFRGILTVSQFAATIALIAVSTLIIKQVIFMKETDLGFQKDATLIIRMNNELRQNYDVFKNRISSIPQVEKVARSRAIPGQAQERNTFRVNDQLCPVWYWAVDDEYMDMMGFKIVEGRNFLKNSQAEERNVICNETAAKKYNWTLGTNIGQGVLVGIMKDFNYVSLREEVEPFAFWYTNSNNALSYVSVKLKGNLNSDILKTIENAFNENSPYIPFRYYFLDEHLNLLYSKENQQVKLITSFSLLSVIVSILGILGLSTFMCQYRIKEIGIRKVNGAKVTEMLAMLNRDVVKWVIIAFVISTPLAWYIMRLWLESFVYRTEISLWIFLLAGVTALMIALVTVSWQSWKAAVRNPVEVLRYE